MSDDIELCIAIISQCEINDHQLVTLNIKYRTLSVLIPVRGGDHLLHLLL